MPALSSKSPKNKRFLFLITHYYPVVYGAELFVKEIAERLVADGHQVDIVTGQWDPSWKQTDVYNGVHIHRVKSPAIRYLQTILFVIPQWLKAKSLLSKHHYDYIHAHIFPGLITAAFLGKKDQRIVTIQGGDLADYAEVYGVTARFLKPVIGYCLKQYGRIHVVSKDLQKKVFEMSSQKGIIIPNGVSSKLASLTSNKSTLLKKYTFPKTRYVLYSPSRLTEKNNLERTIDAISQLRKKKIDVGLLVAGEGHLRIHLEKKVTALNLEKEIVFLGATKHQDSLKIAKVCDALIRVSTHEGFGIALLEGMALGIPVITSTRGGLSDFATDQTATLAKPESVASISAAIETVLTQKVDAKTAHAQKNVASSYTWEHIYKKCLSLLYKL